MSVYAELRGFVRVHRDCGILRGASDSTEAGDIRIVVKCPCGARFGRIVDRRDPDAGLLRESLAAFQAGEPGPTS
jgi:hypothetical protein